MFWVKNYPNSDDPKNIDYVLWKHGLNKNMNIDAALDAMTHDPDRLKLVYGLSKEQLRERFGELRESNPSISCKAPQGEEAVYLKHNLWVVVLKDGKAIDLILCKG